MSDPDEPTRAWRPDDLSGAPPPPTRGAESVPPEDATQAGKPANHVAGDAPAQRRVFVPAPAQADPTRVFPRVEPVAYEERTYAGPVDDGPPRSNGPMIAVVVLLALILLVGGLVLFTTLNRKDNSPDTVPSTTEASTSTTLPTTSPLTSLLPTTIPSTVAPPTTPPTTSTTSTTTTTAPPTAVP